MQSPCEVEGPCRLTVPCRMVQSRVQIVNLHYLSPRYAQREREAEAGLPDG